MIVKVIGLVLFLSKTRNNRLSVKSLTALPACEMCDAAPHHTIECPHLFHKTMGTTYFAMPEEKSLQHKLSIPHPLHPCTTLHHQPLRHQSPNLFILRRTRGSALLHLPGKL
mmetsp:Transcript_24585/g.67042  ORF Transcript_24585/g.67042 Transcript_24585/m.67042 type:complete len:112 (-) Transcript_24585:324-659(-)|eukprot:scaffold176307_cov24-Tisochrysis_lutea.AAC.1